jgi:hypothetical protein
MYYDTKYEIIIPEVPKNFIRPDGSIWINFHLGDINVLADNGFYTVRNDNNEPPNNRSIEATNEKQIVLDKPYADIVRKWVEISPINHNPSPPLESQIDKDL